MTRLKLDVFGRTVLIERGAEGWETFYVGGEGKRRRADDIFIPAAVPEAELERFVADLCHEWATPRNPQVCRIPSDTAERRITPSDAEAQIRSLVETETRAWDTQDVHLLLGLLHEDMIWPWPPHPRAHDPMQWSLTWGRFDHERWRRGWQELFDTHRLVHNRRTIERIEVSAERDGAFAVVDVDTLWQRHDGVLNHWRGRACKFYTLVRGEWKMIAQTGLLDYEGVGQAAATGTRER